MYSKVTSIGISLIKLIIELKTACYESLYIELSVTFAKKVENLWRVDSSLKQWNIVLDSVTGKQHLSEKLIFCFFSLVALRYTGDPLKTFPNFGNLTIKQC